MEHSGSRSAWMEVDRPRFPPLDEAITCDVCVIGAGITGLTTAYYLAREGQDVVVLETGEILCGETGRTTAHFVNALDDRYMDLEKYHGEAGAKLAAQSHTKAIDAAEAIIKEYSIDCDFRRLPGYLFLTPGEPRKTLEDELAALHRAGLTNMTLQESSPLSFHDLGPSIRFPDQAQLHPVKYLSALATIIRSAGGRIFTHTRATSVEEQPLHVNTEQGHAIRAAHVVVATNAPMDDNVQIYSKQTPYRTYVIAGTMPKGTIEPALFWDTGRYQGESSPVPYHYVRLSPGETEDLLIAGGEDHRSGEADDAGRRFASLEKWTRARFPMMGDIAYRWSGQVMEPYDGLGIIGKLPGSSENIYVATGDSGNGMTHGTIAGMLLTDLIAGRANPWETLYHPGRFKMKAAGHFLKENMETAKDMADWILPGESLENLEKDSGAVIRRGFSKVAVYKDASGKLHERSAVCPHKGCIVRWNGFEKSWDCPCHGSRYDCKGRMLNGPSSMDLPIVG